MDNCPLHANANSTASRHSAQDSSGAHPFGGAQVEPSPSNDPRPRDSDIPMACCWRMRQQVVQHGSKESCQPPALLDAHPEVERGPAHYDVPAELIAQRARLGERHKGLACAESGEAWDSKRPESWAVAGEEAVGEKIIGEATPGNVKGRVHRRHASCAKVEAAGEPVEGTGPSHCGLFRLGFCDVFCL